MHTRARGHISTQIKHTHIHTRNNAAIASELVQQTHAKPRRHMATCMTFFVFVCMCTTNRIVIILVHTSHVTATMSICLVCVRMPACFIMHAFLLTAAWSHFATRYLNCFFFAVDMRRLCTFTPVVTSLMMCMHMHCTRQSIQQSSKACPSQAIIFTGMILCILPNVVLVRCFTPRFPGFWGVCVRFRRENLRQCTEKRVVVGDIEKL